MNVSPGSNMQFKPNRMFGNNDICNFGKHKDKSWYDIANSRNFGYFQWVLDNISIHPNCMDHINCVMQQKVPFLNNNNLQWIKEETPLENGNIQRKYKYTLDEKEMDSPVLEMRYCVSCNYLMALNQYTMDDQKKICDRCCNLSLKQSAPPLPPKLEPNWSQYSHKPEYQNNSFQSQNPNQFRPGFNSRTSNYPYRKSNWNTNYYQ